MPFFVFMQGLRDAPDAAIPTPAGSRPSYDTRAEAEQAMLPGPRRSDGSPHPWCIVEAPDAETASLRAWEELGLLPRQEQ